jgi:hypothetical protein
LETILAYLYGYSIKHGIFAKNIGLPTWTIAYIPIVLHTNSSSESRTQVNVPLNTENLETI